jgi:hypothetical protein
VTPPCLRGQLLLALAAVLAAALLAGCTGVDDLTHPTVVSAVVEDAGDGTFTVAATISSPYDSRDRFADAFRVSTPDGEVLGVRELSHPHADEQPFTRSLVGLEIPDDVDEVVVEGRDSVNGWGGTAATVPVRRG